MIMKGINVQAYRDDSGVEIFKNQLSILLEQKQCPWLQ